MVRLRYKTYRVATLKNVLKYMYIARQAKIPISPVRAVAKSGQNLHWTHLWIAKDAKFLHADNEDSNQTARMHRLI